MAYLRNISFSTLDDLQHIICSLWALDKIDFVVSNFQYQLACEQRIRSFFALNWVDSWSIHLSAENKFEYIQCRQHFIETCGYEYSHSFFNGYINMIIRIFTYHSILLHSIWVLTCMHTHTHPFKYNIHKKHFTNWVYHWKITPFKS
jgi:hypothetical protein